MQYTPYVALETMLNQQNTFFFIALTFLIEDWLLSTKSKMLTNVSLKKNEFLVNKTLLFGEKISITDSKSILETTIQHLKSDSPV